MSQLQQQQQQAAQQAQQQNADRLAAGKVMMYSNSCHKAKNDEMQQSNKSALAIIKCFCATAQSIFNFSVDF
jgi:hypothetical protein